MNKRYVYGTVLAGFASITFFAYKARSHDDIICKSDVSFIRDSERLNLSVTQKLIDNNGTMSISGILYSRKHVVGYISKTVDFSYRKMEDTYYLTSKSVLNSPQITLSLQQQQVWLPNFFMKKGERLTLEMKRINKYRWMIFSETVPLFMCERGR